jgi:hypothetical protein
MVIQVERLSRLYCLWKGKTYQITSNLSLGLFVQVFDLTTLGCELVVPGPIRKEIIVVRVCDKDRNPL